MDTLHSVLRSIRSEPPRRDHLRVFREFLSHLDRAGRRQRVRPEAGPMTGFASRDVKAWRNGKNGKRGKR